MSRVVMVMVLPGQRATRDNPPPLLPVARLGC